MTDKQNDKTTDKPKVQTIHFKLSDRHIKFETPDGNVALNRLDGTTTGSVNSGMRITWRMVQNALYHGILIETDKKEKSEDATEPVDLTNFAEDKGKLRLDAAQYLRKLKKDQLIERIDTIKDPQLIAVMIEQESYGRNVSKRKRDDVIAALKRRLQYVQENMEHKQASMLAYTEAEDPKPVIHTPQS